MYQAAYRNFLVRLDQWQEAGLKEPARSWLTTFWERAPEEWWLRYVRSTFTFVRYRRMNTPFPYNPAGDTIVEHPNHLDDAHAYLTRQLLERSYLKLMNHGQLKMLYDPKFTSALAPDTYYDFEHKTLRWLSDP